MLTVFTEKNGIMKAAAKGVRRMNSKFAAAAQFLCYCDFEMYAGGEVANINNIRIIDAFLPISEDIVKLSAFAYLADIINFGMGYECADSRVLKLFLNTLYMCAYRNYDCAVAKVIFELRFMAYIGFIPHLGSCAECGSDKPEYFDLSRGVICKNCHDKHKRGIRMSQDAYYAICYILASEEKKVFSFKISEEILKEVSEISERYVMFHLDRSFASLEYFKAMTSGNRGG